MLLRRYSVPCEPPLWARGGHAQTLFGHVLPAVAPRVSDRAVRTRRVDLGDGDQLVVHELPGTSGVRVHLFHGLSGDADADYMRRTAAALGARGHEVWACNHRGCGAGRGLARRPYHSGSSEDLRAVLAASRADAPDRVHLAIGFSLSGNAALLQAIQHLAPLPDGLVAVNPPVDIGRASVDIGRGLNRLYELRFLWRLRRAIRERERDGLLDRHYAIPLTASLIEFDDLFTAPEAGFESGQDYYDKCSTVGRLAEIDVPTVLVTTADDPFVDARAYEGRELSESILLHIEPSGGHVGYLTRRGLGNHRWLDNALLHYVDDLARVAR